MENHQDISVEKRDGRIVPFDESRIIMAIGKALRACESGDPDLAGKLGRTVSRRIRDRYSDSTPSVEDIQDEVERVLVEEGLSEVAKKYILYREQRSQEREAKSFIGVKDDLKLTVNAVNILQKRYLRRDDQGKVAETPAEMFDRVARSIAKVDSQYDSNSDIDRTEDRFNEIMRDLLFLPNSPTLMNAGTRIGQLSACFVVPIEDSMESIFEALKNMALIHQSGGGTGFSFSKLRPSGDIVASTKGVASGPVSFISIFDTATEVVKQGGRRRGANMGVLSVHHPDITDFINAKSEEDDLSNFNLSVAVTNEFMEAKEENREYDLVNPRTGSATESVNARDIYDMIVASAWKTGEPGMIFIDEINRQNPTPDLGSIESTNPCGEAPLLPFESCNLGSINLSKVVDDGEIDWDLLGSLVETGVHFLDNVISANRYPISQATEMARGNRKIGLGVMGLAEMLIKLRIPYDTQEALSVGEKVMEFIARRSEEASRELAEARGSFPNIESSIWSDDRPMRNATRTAIAPTGTISMIAGTSSGIEPLFAVAYVRKAMGSRLVEVNSVFEDYVREEGLYNRDLMNEVARKGSLSSISSLPQRARKLFVTSLEVAPEWHVKMQAAFQKHVDNGVSKTVNLPQDAGLSDIASVFDLAYRLECKGVTVYRYGSRSDQVLYAGGEGEANAGACPSSDCSY